MMQMEHLKGLYLNSKQTKTFCLRYWVELNGVFAINCHENRFEFSLIRPSTLNFKNKVVKIIINMVIYDWTVNYGEVSRCISDFKDTGNDHFILIKFGSHGI